MLHGCTAIQRNFSAHARVLAESFLAHHPGARFSVLVLDGPVSDLEGRPYRALGPADIGIDPRELARRATMYTAQGLVSAHKPDIVGHLLREGADTVVLLDADSCVYGELGFLAELVRRHSLVLSPHSPDPHPLSGHYGPEQVILRSGVINGGLLAAGVGAREFLDWWSRRTARHCVVDQDLSLTYSQGWLTLAVALFEHHILRARGCNVMGWNLHTRDIQWEGSTPTIDGGLLRHFHFAGGFDPGRPQLLATSPAAAEIWPSLKDRPGTRRLCRQYGERLVEYGYAEAVAQLPRFDTMPGGRQIEPWMRRVYRDALITAEGLGEPEPPNPFADGDECFAAWLGERIGRAGPAAAHVPGELEPSDRELRRAAEALAQTTAAYQTERAARLRVEREAERMWSEIQRLEAERGSAPAHHRSWPVPPAAADGR